MTAEGKLPLCNCPNGLCCIRTHNWNGTEVAVCHEYLIHAQTRQDVGTGATPADGTAKPLASLGIFGDVPDKASAFIEAALAFAAAHIESDRLHDELDAHYELDDEEPLCPSDTTLLESACEESNERYNETKARLLTAYRAL